MPSGFSTDGFIIDQNCFSGYLYRGIGSDINGCGWVAAFNLLHALERDVSFDAVHREMDAMFPLKIPGPTPMRLLIRYLARRLPVRIMRGRRKALAAAAASSAGILRYWEGKEPHYIAFLRAEGDIFRFFNVADGLEDMTDAMEHFFRFHCRRGWIRVIVPR